MALATLTVDFLARVGNLESAVGRTANITRGQARIIERAFDGVSASVRNLGGIIAGAFSGAALSTGFRAVVDGLDALNDASDATGISVERLSGLQNFIGGFGGDLQDVTSLVLIMNRALSRADDDDSKGVSKALAAIGLEAEALRKLEPDVALIKIAQALDRFRDGGDKTRVIQTIFKDAQAAAPVLKDLAGAGALNATATAQQAEAAERFNKQIAAFRVGVVNASRDVVVELLPALEQIGIKSEAARVANASLLEQIRAGFRGDQGTDQLKDRIAEIDAELAKLDARRRAPGSIFKGGLFGLANDIDESRLINERIGLIEKLNRAQAKAAAPSAPAAAAKPAVKFDGVLNQDPTGNGKTAGKSQADFVEEFTVSQMKDARREFEAVQKARIEGERAAAEATVNSRIAVDDLVKHYQDLADPTRRYREELQLVTALEATGRLSAEDAFNARMRLIEQETAALQGQSKTVKEGESFAREFGLTFSSALEGTILKTSKLSDLVRSLGQDILQIAIRKSFTQPFGEAVSGFFDSIFSANGNAFGPGGLIPFAQGGVVNSPTLFRFASGGSFSSGVMGEAGPEAILPLQRGADGKLGVVASGSRASNDQQPISITLQITTGVQSTVRSEIVALMPQIQQQVTAGIIDARRRGGAMARAFGG